MNTSFQAVKFIPLKSTGIQDERMRMIKFKFQSRQISCVSYGEKVKNEIIAQIYVPPWLITVKLCSSLLLLFLGTYSAGEL